LYSAVWRSDPKKLVITLSRYKFVAKMLRNKSKVLEIGCAEGWAASLSIELLDASVDATQRYKGEHG